MTDPRVPRPAPRLAGRLAIVLAAAIAVAACDPAPSPSTTPAATTAVTSQPTTTPAPGTTESPTTSGPPAAAHYAEIRAAVAAIRGLQPSADVEPVTLDEAQLRTNITAEFDKQNTPAELRASEEVLIALGLLPPGSSLRTIMLDFQTGQVAGYYSPDSDELYVVSRSGGLGATERVTYAHEYTHQLQDQDLGLDDLGLDASDQSDRSLGRLSLVEGDATSVQTQWMLGNLAPEELGELLGSALDPEALEALLRAPAYIRETALFPYQQGAAFVDQLLTSGGYAAVDAAYDTPPDSTEQILHPELFVDRQVPIQVELPTGLAAAAGAGWTEAGRDTLGELILGIWLRVGGTATAESGIAAAGWGGDRLALLRGPAGEVAVALMTDWDSDADAIEFETAAVAALPTLASTGHAIGREGSIVAIGIGPVADELLAALLP